MPTPGDFLFPLSHPHHGQPQPNCRLYRRIPNPDLLKAQLHMSKAQLMVFSPKIAGLPSPLSAVAQVKQSRVFLDIFAPEPITTSCRCYHEAALTCVHSSLPPPPGADPAHVSFVFTFSAHTNPLSDAGPQIPLSEGFL